MNLFQFDSRIEYFFNMTQELNPSFLHDSIEWNLFQKMTHRIDFCLNVTQRIEPLFSDMIQRIELFCFWYDSKNWTFSSGMTQRLELFFFWYDSKNWNFFFMTQRFLKYDSKNWTFFQCDSKNWTFLYHSQNWTFL